MLPETGLRLERYLDLLSARQKLTASNIANVDTPGYKTQDIDFRSELASALGSSRNAVEAQGLQTKNDGNNVSLDREARNLSENAIRFAIASNLLQTQLRAVRSAIQEGRNA
ncbi:MAG TPA: flagellar basal body protein [Bryobacteraceae bacterium]|nr:flagellar basal body protein [Bryobacteraceae bacterium]